MMFRSREEVDYFWFGWLGQKTAGHVSDKSVLHYVSCKSYKISTLTSSPHHHDGVRSHDPMGSSLRHRGLCIHSIKSPSSYQACCCFFIVSPPSRAPILCQSSLHCCFINFNFHLIIVIYQSIGTITGNNYVTSTTRDIIRWS
jgi:hypothetical protein